MVATEHVSKAAPPPYNLAPVAAILGSDWIRYVILAVAAFVVRLPALQGLPVWDDDWLINANPFIKSPLLIAEAFRHYLFLDGFSTHYRPVQNASFAFDYLIWNGDPYGYHLTNILLHLTSGVLLYCLLRGLFAHLQNGPFAKASSTTSTDSCSHWAFVVALLWVVHPVHSAAIDYISGRADSLSFVFACGGWLICLRAQAQVTRRSRITHYIAAGICGMLALCSREIAIVWLCLFLLHRLCFEAGVSRQVKLVSVVCCLLLLSGYVGLRQLPTRPAGAPAAEEGNPIPLRAVLMLRALGDYSRLMVAPSKLGMERTLLDYRNYRSTPSWRESAGTEYLSLLGVALLALFVCGISWKGLGRPLRIFGALWFLFAYLPISNVVELNANVAEHWLYLPSVGLLIFAAGATLGLPARGRKLTSVFACVAICALSARAYSRSSDWITPKIFFQRTIANGGASPRAAANLGLIYAKEGAYTKAEAIFRHVLEVVPDYPAARNGLASVLYLQGKHGEGESAFAVSHQGAERARTEYPSTWVAVLSIARLRHADKDDLAALQFLEKAHRDYPQVWDIVSLQSEILRQTKGPQGALSVVAEFADANWWHFGAAIALGQLLAEKGEVEAAVEQLRFASWLDVHDAEALSLIAALRLRQNRLEEAYAAQARAVSRQPDQPRRYRLLSDILSRMGRSSEAQCALNKMLDLEAVSRAQIAAN